MNHTVIVKGYGDILSKLGKAVKGKRESIDLFFSFNDEKTILFVSDEDSGTKIALAQKQSTLIPYWQPIDVAYMAIDFICELHRGETKGSGSDNLDWRDNRFIELVRSNFSNLNLGDAYSPKN